MCNYAFLCLYFLFFKSWANFSKASYVCVSIFHCLHFGKADGFCKITSKLVCVFSFVFMCLILEKFVFKERF